MSIPAQSYDSTKETIVVCIDMAVGTSAPSQI